MTTGPTADETQQRHEFVVRLVTDIYTAVLHGKCDATSRLCDEVRLQPDRLARQWISTLLRDLLPAHLLAPSV